MAQLKELRTRIAAIKSTCKITSAMKMIAAARLRKVQILVDKSLAYSENLRLSTLRVLTQIEHDEKEHNVQYIRPTLLRNVTNSQKYLLYVLSSERGLCGAYNTNIFKKASERIKYLQKQNKEIEILCIGKKVYSSLKRHFNESSIKISLLHSSIEDKPYTEMAKFISHSIIKNFNNKTFDICEFVYAKFTSTINRDFIYQQVCPVELNTQHLDDKELELMLKSDDAEYEYLPDKITVLSDILPILFNDNIFKIIVNSAASEHSARMSSMDNATNNAKNMISDLTLKYNSLRQSAITTELIEIIAGAEAM